MWVQKQQQARPQAAAAAQEASTTSRLSLYDAPPAEVVAIEDFEAFAIDRLKGAHSPLQLLQRALHVWLTPWAGCSPEGDRKRQGQGLQVPPAAGPAPHASGLRAAGRPARLLTDCPRGRTGKGKAVDCQAPDGGAAGGQPAQGPGLPLCAAPGLLPHGRAAPLVRGAGVRPLPLPLHAGAALQPGPSPVPASLLQAPHFGQRR